MPLYEYECEFCRCSVEIRRTVEERDSVPECLCCLEPMKLQISAVHGIVKNPAAGHTRRV